MRRHVISAFIATSVISFAPATAALAAVGASGDEAVALTGEMTFIDVLGNDAIDEPVESLTVDDAESDRPGAASVGLDPATGDLGVFYAASETVYPTSFGEFGSSQAFSYEVCGVSGSCATAWVSITQTSAEPVLVDDATTVVAGDTVSIDVYANDSGFNGNAITPTVTEEPTSGAASVYFAGSDYYQIAYTADPGEATSDSFTYEVCNVLGACSAASVLITVESSEGLAQDDSIVVPPDEATWLQALIFENDPILESYYSGSVSVTTQPQHAVATGAFDSEGGLYVDYEPAAGYSGADSFEYEICRPAGGSELDGAPPICDSASVAVQVADFGANPDYASNVPAVQYTIDVLANDVGVVGSPSISIVTPPQHGSALVVDTEGQLTVMYDADGSSLVDTLTYEICEGAVCSAAEVYISIDPAAVPPQTVDDLVSVMGDGRWVDIDVLENDSGYDPDTLDVIVEELNGHAIVVDGGERPLVRYAVATDTSDFADSFTYLVCNSSAEEQTCSSGNVTVDVTAVNDLGIDAVDDQVSADVSRQTSLDVTANDVVGAGGFSIEIVDQSPVVNAALGDVPGEIEFTPETSGSMSVLYRLCDAPAYANATHCDFATVMIDAADIVLNAADDEATAASGEATEIDVIDNDEGFDGLDPLSIVVGAEPQNGSAAVVTTGDGQQLLLYTSLPGFVGTDTFDYEVCDSELNACDEATVIVTVEEACTITGTSGDDIIEGTAGKDVICARGGDDTINARGGDDIVYAGAGDDDVAGGAGNDTIYGGGGADVVRGYAGDDIIRGGSGDDELRGGAGNDVVRGSGGLDSLYGGDGLDALYGGADDDVLSGGGDTDYLFGRLGNDDLSGGSGDDIVRGNSGDDVARGNSGDDAIYGGNDDDSMLGNAGDDQLRGGGGTDEANGGSGLDGCNAETETNCESSASYAGPGSLRVLSEDTATGSLGGPLEANAGGISAFCGVESDLEDPTVYDFVCHYDAADGAGPSERPANTLNVSPDARFIPDQLCFIAGASDIRCLDERTGRVVSVAWNMPLTFGTVIDVAVAATDRISDLGPDEWTMCVITDSGSTLCRGDNTAGTLGDGTATDSVVPVVVNSPVAFDSIDMSDRTVCATSSDALYCWGDNSSGQVGNGAIGGFVSSPERVESIGASEALAVSGQTVCAIETGGSVWCWGLYHGTQAESAPIPTPVASPVNLSAQHPEWGLNTQGNPQTLDASSRHICYVDAQQLTFCWGEDGEGQVSGEDPTRDPWRTEPVSLDGPGPAVNGVTAGEGFTVVWESGGGQSRIAGATTMEPSMTEPETSFYGYVYDSSQDGVGIAGASVVLLDQAGGTIAQSGTDIDGRYEFALDPVLTSGTAILRADADGFDTRWLGGAAQFEDALTMTIAEQTEGGNNISLPPTIVVPELTGVVIDEDTESPIAGAVVTALDESGVSVLSTTTDELGEYVLSFDEGDVGVDVVVQATADGYETRWSGGATTFDGADSIELELEVYEPIEFVLPAIFVPVSPGPFAARALPDVPDGSEWDVLFGANLFCGSTTDGNSFCLQSTGGEVWDAEVGTIALADGSPLPGTVVAADDRCLLTSTSEVFCVSTSLDRDDITGDLTGQMTAEPVPAGDTAGASLIAIESSPYIRSTCVIDDVGTAYCQGDNGIGQLGDGTYEDRDGFVTVNLPEAVIDLDTETGQRLCHRSVRPGVLLGAKS